MYRNVSNTLLKIQEKRGFDVRLLSVKPCCTGSLESGRGAGGGGGAILRTKTFHGLLGQLKEVVLGVSTTASG